MTLLSARVELHPHSLAPCVMVTDERTADWFVRPEDCERFIMELIAAKLQAWPATQHEDNDE